MTFSKIPPPADAETILPGFSFADCYSSPAPAGLDAIQAAQDVFAAGPRWIHWLLELRNALGRLVRLKAAPSSGFPIISSSPELVVLGFDDWHLDFRIVFTARPNDVSNVVSLATLVRTHNFWGRAYLFVIMPFHNLIARRTVEGVEVLRPR